MHYFLCICTGMEMSSVWHLWHSLETLKTSFNVSSEYQGCHSPFLCISMKNSSVISLPSFCVESCVPSEGAQVTGASLQHPSAAPLAASHRKHHHSGTHNRQATQSHCITVLHLSQTLTLWDRDKMDAISQTTISNAFSWMKMFWFRLKFHWSVFL